MSRCVEIYAEGCRKTVEGYRMEIRMLHLRDDPERALALTDILLEYVGKQLTHILEECE